MVAVFVREENRVDVFQRFIRIMKELAKFPLRKTRVDQDPRFLRAQHRAITRTPAAKNSETHRHVTIPIKRRARRCARDFCKARSRFHARLCR